MRYRRYGRVTFTAYNGSIKLGKLLEYYNGKWWIQVKENFSYQLPIEVKGKIIMYVNQSSHATDYYVSEWDIIGYAVIEVEAPTRGVL